MLKGMLQHNSAVTMSYLYLPSQLLPPACAQYSSVLCQCHRNSSVALCLGCTSLPSALHRYTVPCSKLVTQQIFVPFPLMLSREGPCVEKELRI